MSIIDRHFRNYILSLISWRFHTVIRYYIHPRKVQLAPVKGGGTLINCGTLFPHKNK